MKRIALLIVAAASLLTGCGSVGSSADHGSRWTAWENVAKAEAENRNPTLKVTQYREDGVTPAATIVMDLAPVLGGGARAMPRGAVAEGVLAVGSTAAKILNTPVSTVLGASVLVGQAAGSSTSINNESGAVNIGPGVSTGATTHPTTFVDPEVEGVGGEGE
jgi:hypothetical protein